MGKIKYYYNTYTIKPNFKNLYLCSVHLSNEIFHWSTTHNFTSSDALIDTQV